jgi:hypothetical protein
MMSGPLRIAGKVEEAQTERDPNNLKPLAAVRVLRPEPTCPTVPDSR